MEERHTQRLRGLLARPGCLVAPGVADALAARLVARAARHFKGGDQRASL